MHGKIFSLLLIIAMAVFGLASPVQADTGLPVAVIESNVYDFGAVYEGADVIHEFVIQNKGDADLEITDVKTG